MREKLAKYEQIRQDIIHKIESMEYRPNQVIPSENELCASYGVSRITVRKAIDELVHEGLLYRIKGKGSFVRDHGSEGLSRIYSFTEAILHQGKTPSKKLLSLKVEEADADIRRRMGLEEGRRSMSSRAFIMRTAGPTVSIPLSSQGSCFPSWSYLISTATPCMKCLNPFTSSPSQSAPDFKRNSGKQ